MRRAVTAIAIVLGALLASATIAVGVVAVVYVNSATAAPACDVTCQNLAATEEALESATSTIETARARCREQIVHWRHLQRSWVWIQGQPTWLAFRALGGS